MYHRIVNRAMIGVVKHNKSMLQNKLVVEIKEPRRSRFLRLDLRKRADKARAKMLLAYTSSNCYEAMKGKVVRIVDEDGMWIAMGDAFLDRFFRVDNNSSKEIQLKDCNRWTQTPKEGPL